MSTDRLLAMLLAIALPGATASWSGEDEIGHREQPHDPPVLVEREAQPRSESTEVVRGQIRSVQVNVDSAGNNILGDAANEPSIAIDPTNPDNIVIGWRQFDSVQSNFRQAGYAYSHDGGASWTFPGVLQPGQFRSDPVLAADAFGNFYYYSLSSGTSVELFISSDGGVSWTPPIPGFGGDKEWMTVDATGGIGDGHVYTIWNSQFTCCAAGTDFTRSTGGEPFFEGPYALPEKPKWGTLDVGPDGELYVVGTRINPSSFPNLYFVQKSTNARDENQLPVFGPAVPVALGGILAPFGAPNPGGLLGQLWIAVDRSTGASRGNVYVLASVTPPNDDPLDVMLSRSTDGGDSWSAPVRVNDDPAVAGSFQWFGTMSVAPNGRIDVAWADTRNDLSGTSSELYYSYSTDTGDTWAAGLPFTPAWNSLVGHPNQNKIGDYYHMVSGAEGASLAYAATFNGEQDVYFVRLGDCNANGLHDSTDLANVTSLDCNTNGIPDECEENLPCAGCTADEDCDDADPCNGIESCVSDICQPGIPILCDDGEFCNGPESCNAEGSCEPAPPPCGPSDVCFEETDSCCTVVAEICDDLIDNDCDLVADCLDPDCSDRFGCRCDDDGVCEPGETCDVCPGDCPTGPSGCGNGVCEPALGEDCLSCPGDCAGGAPLDGFCCGDGDGAFPVDCGDSRCTSGSLQCSETPIPAACCGDLNCDADEDAVSCAVDCVPPSGAGALVDDSVSARLRSDGQVTLSWGVSCALTDWDYEIYEGQVGDFTTHVPVFCSTGGATSMTFGPGPGSRYFLVVPRNAIHEGSYGVDVGGNERPPGAEACLPQALAFCP